MKKLIIFMFSIVLITSCSKECDQWYEGSSCDIEMRDKFYGVFIGTLTGAGQTQTVSTSITPNSDGVQKLTIDGVAFVELSTSTTFTYPTQTVVDPTNGNWTIDNGSGVLDEDNLTYNFYATINGQSFNFGFVGSR